MLPINFFLIGELTNQLLQLNATILYNIKHGILARSDFG